MIHFHQISKRYPGGHEALKEVSFHLQPQEMAFLTGRSGAGKSTLLKLIAFLERPTRGHIVVHNKNLAKIKLRRIPYFRRELGLVFQDNKLLYDRSVFDNVALPLVVAGIAHADIGRRVRAALARVGLLAKEKAYPITLSGGEQQRVGIARAIVHKPAVLLADEPTGNLDAQLSDQIMDLFCDFNAHGVTVLVATHDLHQVQRLRKRVLALEDGRLVHDQAPMT